MQLISPNRFLCRALLALFFVAQSALAAPTVSVTSPTPGTTVSSLTSISITFSEPVTGVDADDLIVNGDAAAIVTGSGAGPYVFTFTQPAPGQVTVDWAGDHGIAGQGGTGAFVPGLFWTYTLTDTIAPTIAVTSKLTITVTNGGTGYTVHRRSLFQEVAEPEPLR
jgi:hypothetical protein